MDIKDFTPNMVVSGPMWNESVRVYHIEPVGEYVKLRGAGTASQKLIEDLIPISDISKITSNSNVATFSKDACKVFLALEARRYKFASLYDPLLAINVSKISPLPHQIEAVYSYILKKSAIKFLLADDPGAGKTIMAGLVVKELKLRRQAARVLIVVPGHLKDQWIRELYDKFAEKFVIVDSSNIKTTYPDNPFESNNLIISSIDFLKQDHIKNMLTKPFDLIVIDEAHKMNAVVYGSDIKKTKRYRLGEILSKKCTHFLFLTATPHSGDHDSFRLLLSLLEPGFFATNDLTNQFLKEQPDSLFLRRKKEDMKDFEGKPLFVPRKVQTPDITLTVLERELYDSVSAYVKDQYNLALRLLENKQSRNIGFALVILQRRLASSTYAVCESLKRRKIKLQNKRSDYLAAAKTGKRIMPLITSYDDEFLDEAEEEWEKRSRLEADWETVTTAQTTDELDAEIETVEKLICKARSVMKQGLGAKLQQLKDTLSKLEGSFPAEKILIFTESTDTLNYLKDNIESWGYSVVTIHGGMSHDSRRDSESIFKNKKQILVATEAAGEGINLQFCHLMINYDIPWNPNRLEQRMGRIHRYGQQDEVTIFNLIAADTREGEVMITLFKKLGKIKEVMHSDKVFDVITSIQHGTTLQQLLIDAAISARTQTAILKDLKPELDADYIKRLEKDMEGALATKAINWPMLQETREKARENRLIPEYTQAFFEKAFRQLGGSISKKNGGFASIERIPPEIKSIADDDIFKREHGNLKPRYSKIVFDKESGTNPRAEFVTFGHPLFEAILKWIDKNLSDDAQIGSTFIDPTGKHDGYILFYAASIMNGNSEPVGERLLACFVDSDGDNPRIVSPTILWDLEESSNNTNDESIARVDLELSADPLVLKLLSDYKNELHENNKKNSKRDSHGLKSMDKAIAECYSTLTKYELKSFEGKNMDLAIINKKAELEERKRLKAELVESIRIRDALSLKIPTLFGIVKVKPTMKSVRDPDVEKVGMDIAMKFEKSEGRFPTDISKENRGFDILSKDHNNNTARYIEVKSRSKIGPVTLTRNEFFKSHCFGDDFYLYVVWNTGHGHDLRVIQNPAANLSMDEQIVQYVVAADEIGRKGKLS